MSSAWQGWALALAALAAGWFSYGWQGLLLAVTVTVFWLLLQFSRAVRVLRIAGGRPVGEVASAVMLNARLHAGMRMPQVLALTHSLGRKVSEDPGSSSECWVWTDAAGDRVELSLVRGQLARWTLTRSEVPVPGADRVA